MTHWFALGIAILASAAANVSLKLFVREHPEWLPGSLVAAMLDVRLLLSLLACFALFGAYLYAIRQIPLAVSYPVLAASSCVAVSISSSVLFRDFTWSRDRVLALVLIVVGVALLSRPTAQAAAL